MGVLERLEVSEAYDCERDRDVLGIAKISDESIAFCSLGSLGGSASDPGISKP
jgi:hypothetical protein